MKQRIENTMEIISFDEIQASMTTRQRIQTLLAKDPDGALQALADLGYRRKADDKHRPGSLAIKAAMPKLRQQAVDQARERALKLFEACKQADMCEIFGGVMAEVKRTGGDFAMGYKLLSQEKAIESQINVSLKRGTTPPKSPPTEFGRMFAAPKTSNNQQ